MDESATIDQVPRWFEGATLSFAENVLYSRAPGDPPGHRSVLPNKEDGRVAITEVREGGSATRECSWGELRSRAAALAAAMYHAKGVRRGDRVVAVAANSVETFVVWLATNWLGAIFSSSSTDMGTKGILQRSVQANPKVCWSSARVVIHPVPSCKLTESLSSFSWTTRLFTTVRSSTSAKR